MTIDSLKREGMEHVKTVTFRRENLLDEGHHIEVIMAAVEGKRVIESDINDTYTFEPDGTIRVWYHDQHDDADIDRSFNPGETISGIDSGVEAHATRMRDVIENLLVLKRNMSEQLIAQFGGLHKIAEALFTAKVMDAYIKEYRKQEKIYPSV